MRVVYIAIGILVLALAATGLAETTLALGKAHLGDDQNARPAATVTPTPTATATPTATPKPIITPAPTPAAKTATTTSFVRLRAGASTSSAILAELNGGTVVTLGTYSDSLWQQVRYNGLSGYIYKSYLRY